MITDSGAHKNDVCVETGVESNVHDVIYEWPQSVSAFQTTLHQEEKQRIKHPLSLDATRVNTRINVHVFTR
jgi:hypothetical protein